MDFCDSNHQMEAIPALREGQDASDERSARNSLESKNASEHNYSNDGTDDSRSVSGSGTFRSLSRKFSRSRSLKKKTQPRVLSPAERDLRLLSDKAALSYHQTRFDKFLGQSGLVLPYLFCIMLLTYSIPIAFLVMEELDPDFAEYGRWVWRYTVILQILITTPMWIAMMQWRKYEALNFDGYCNRTILLTQF